MFTFRSGRTSNKNMIIRQLGSTFMEIGEKFQLVVKLREVCSKLIKLGTVFGQIHFLGGTLLDKTISVVFGLELGLLGSLLTGLLAFLFPSDTIVK